MWAITLAAGWTYKAAKRRQSSSLRRVHGCRHALYHKQLAGTVTETTADESDVFVCLYPFPKTQLYKGKRFNARRHVNNLPNRLPFCFHYVGDKTQSQKEIYSTTIIAWEPEYSRQVHLIIMNFCCKHQTHAAIIDKLKEGISVCDFVCLQKHTNMISVTSQLRLRYQRSAHFYISTMHICHLGTWPHQALGCFVFYNEIRHIRGLF